MAENISRSFRSRDRLSAGQSEPAPRRMADDPLAELARLIGQGDPPAREPGYRSRQTPVATREMRLPPAPQLESWGSDQDNDQHGEAVEPYADEQQYADPHYAEDGAAAQPHYEDGYDDRYENGHDAPALADPYPAYPRGPGLPFEPMIDAQQATARRGARDYAPIEQPHERADEGQDAFDPPPADDPHDGPYDYEQQQAEGVEPDYAIEEYEDDGASHRRRGGLVLVAAVLGLAVLGTAGAFAYRAMFGGSVIPSLPPIIKASDGPNKIMPPSNVSQSDSTDQADASGTGPGEKLVSREEQPVNVQPPAAPRAVSTIPVFPDPNSGAANVMAPGGAAGLPVPGVQTTVVSAPAPQGPVVPSMTAPPPAAMPPAAAVSTGPKKIHTVTIRPDGSDAAMPSPGVRAAMQALPAGAAAPRQIAPQAARSPGGASGPLALVPQDDSAPQEAPVRTRTALARTPASTAAPTAAASGGYSVQVTSQRSEAEAQAAFRSLRAKYPTQLGSREATIRHVDLGSKGSYYRALVGPFSSMEEAAGLCSSLKAAGGNCIVQRD